MLIAAVKLYTNRIVGKYMAKCLIKNKLKGTLQVNQVKLSRASKGGKILHG
jgi:hypothetical protein